MEWNDVDLSRSPAHVLVRRSEWKGHVAAPKGGRSRRIPLTSRLAGHKDLGTTQMYMHLTPATLEQAIRLLDGDGSGAGGG